MKRLLIRVILIAVVAGIGLSTAHAVGEPPNHRLEVRLDPASNKIEISDRITIRGAGPIQFRLAPRFAITGLRVDGNPKRVEEGAHIVQVDLGEDGAHTVDLEYEATLPPTDRSQIGGFGPVISDDGSYLPAGSGWVARITDGDISYHVTVSVPEPQKAVATGRLITDGRVDGVYRASFVEKRPSEGPSLFAGPYSITEKMAGDIRLRTYFHPEIADYAASYLDQSSSFITRFASEFGAYPFQDFHIVSAPLPVGLGFPNLAYISQKIIPFSFMTGQSLAHEIVHNWFGNGVLVDYSNGNWAEGLTTYVADYAVAADGEPDAQKAMRIAWLRDFAALPSDQDFPLRQFTSRQRDSTQVVGYKKAAFVFHMLEQKIGEDAFSDGLKDLWTRKKFEVATWSDLEGSFQKMTDIPLEEFFQQWVDRSGAPRVELISAVSAPDGDGYAITATVRMMPAEFEVQMPVIIETKAGVEERVLDLSGDSIIGEWRVEDQPISISLDPDYHVFRKLLIEESPPILRDVTLSASTIASMVADDPQAVEDARQIAKGLLGNSLRFAGLNGFFEQATPFLIIGMSQTIEEALDEIGLPPPPPEVAGRGTGRMWTARIPTGRPYAVIAVDTEAAMATAARLLPHYTGMSYLIFDGDNVVSKGVWQPTTQPLKKTFPVSSTCPTSGGDQSDEGDVTLKSEGC
jgi:hypothetical protein